jgi:adenine-specific DNA-methyltransferase
MGLQYIGIEQLDYYENDSVSRLKNTIKGDQTGISKAVNWQGGGSFVYLELKKWNDEAKEKIAGCSSLNELEKLLDELAEKYFLHYNVKLKEFKEKIIYEDNFKKLPLNKQKEMFCKMLDLNQLYVNASEMEDKKYGLSKEDIALTKNFYSK